MLLSGHMIVKNGVKFDYSFIESCLSILPICDEFIFLEGFSEDNTYDKLVELQSLYPDKIKIIRQKWEKNHYSVMADMTNVCIEHCKGEYNFGIQADEAVHEMYHQPILNILKSGFNDMLRLGVYHFFSKFDTIYSPGVFYDTFIRISKTSLYPHIRCDGDSMSYGCPNCDSAKYNIGEVSGKVKVYHYGYMRKPLKLIEKQKDITKLYGIIDQDPYLVDGLNTGTIKWNDKIPESRLRKFPDPSHPASMINWIEERKHLVENGIVKEG